MTGDTYATALARGTQQGAGRCDNAAAMALFCEHDIQLLAGAVSPEFVWNGARASGLSLLGLARLCAESPTAVAELMWL